jgi:hypothetical protein
MDQGVQADGRGLCAHLRLEWRNQEYEFDDMPDRA